MGFVVVAVAMYSFFLLRFAMGMAEPGLSLDITNKDFANYWIAAKLTWSGEVRDLFVHELYFQRLQQEFGADYPIHSWSYPPHMLLLISPLGLLEYKAAIVVFLSLTFALFLVAVRVFREAFAPASDRTVLAMACIGYALVMFTAAQNGFLTAALLLCGFAWMKTRPVLAGFAFACLTIKPQLGILLPILLLSDRNWSALAWSTVFTVALVMVSVALLGLKPWVAYASQTLPYQQFVMNEWPGIFLKMMPTVFGGARSLGMSAEAAWSLQWPVTIA